MHYGSQVIMIIICTHDDGFPMKNITVVLFESIMLIVIGTELIPVSIA